MVSHYSLENKLRYLSDSHPKCSELTQSRLLLLKFITTHLAPECLDRLRSHNKEEKIELI